jgi:hypothetical protein
MLSRPAGGRPLHFRLTGSSPMPRRAPLHPVSCEFNPHEGEAGLFFGYVVSPLGPDCDEWGYFDKRELEQVRNRLGLPLERDVWWKPAPIPELQRQDAGALR